MRNPALLRDLAARGYSVPEEPAAIVEQTRLDEAWRALVAEIPSIPTRIAAGMLEEEVVVDTVVRAALRVLRNPEGVERTDYAIDDYREGRTLANATDDVYFTAAELRRLELPEVTGGSMRYC